MRKEYDFSKSRKNPYTKQLKRQITIRLDTATVEHFKKMAAELGMPYQNLINLYLRDCAVEKGRPVIQWLGDSTKRPTGTPVLNAVRGVLKGANVRRGR
jgi:antitoxin component of RelBE/YafQ-DinJ toxin-antitoxin module